MPVGTEGDTASMERVATADIQPDRKEDLDDSTLRQADSHVHGGAGLALALDGERVTAELETPLFNLLGFEHAPETDEQTEAVKDAEMRLKRPGQLIRFNAEAGCKAMAVTGDIALFESGEGHHDEDHESHDDHDKHDDDHGHEDHDSEHSEHRDVIVEYGFSCASPEKLDTVTVALLKMFPLMTELDVVYLGPDRQASFELTPSNMTAKLRS